MRNFILYFILTALPGFYLEGGTGSGTLLEFNSSVGTLIAYQPNPEEMQRTAPAAKAIFQEAFFTSYTDYHRKSGSTEPVEKWLRLREGVSLEGWLGDVFDEEYKEYLVGDKGFIYLCHPDGHLIGWLSHSQVSEKGDLYLSQCSLEASSRNQKVATTAFAEAFQSDNIRRIFPGVGEVKLIVRKINTVARRLYAHAGFIMDETIDPSIYGDSYDDRYVGYRLPLNR
jgi:hypothetical protein